jgi:flavodoxin
MTEPRCLILVKSVHHGNTAQVAREMAGVLGADVVGPEEIPYTSLDQYGLVGFGSGVYYGRMHEALFEWLKGLPDAPEPTRAAFVFSTSGLPFLAKLWHAPLKKLLARKGFEVVGEFACRSFDTWGPLWLTGGLNWRHPNERDLARAREFAGRVGGGLCGSVGRLQDSAMSS